ncbi:hypothetical protein KEM52_006394 [Ascosphaera acerosa]|nr:hypothetical protein KEM52_006394 [Ascosphaera acerosa]
MLKLCSRRSTTKAICASLLAGVIALTLLAHEVIHEATGSSHRLPIPAAFRPPGPAKPDFKPGRLQSEATYTRKLVVAATKTEDTSWIAKALPDLDTAVYVVDDGNATLRTPRNKGREAMVYLTYLLDNYDRLADITIFMHSHRYAWHNAELLDFDASQLLARLRSEKVIHDGYVNLRCIWAPGCPDWIRPGEKKLKEDKPEQAVFAKAWAQLFPSEPVPSVLSQPCCSQFALSRARARAIPRERLGYIRNWLLSTDLDDALSGRVLEYTWQALFTNNHVFCPQEHVCWCETYGLCFESAEQYAEVEALRVQMEEKRKELVEWRLRVAEFEEARTKGDIEKLASLPMPLEKHDLKLLGELQIGARKMKEAEIMAIARGQGVVYAPDRQPA